MPRNAAGLFVTHVDNARVRAHFDRLTAETAGLVDWAVVRNPGNAAEPVTTIRYAPASQLLPLRHAQMVRNGGVQGGFLDVAVIPCVLALDRKHVWVMEYDVDYSGRWSDFFGQFSRNRAGLLTSTLVPMAECERWYHSATAAAPPWVREAHRYRGFHPLMRLSRRFAKRYVALMREAGWDGHYEFTLPTAARAAGVRVEDIGGDGPLTPPRRRNVHYDNSPHDWRLSPGTFVWRPARAHYFHERPEDFAQAGRLHHPVKPGVKAWTGERAAATPP